MKIACIGMTHLGIIHATAFAAKGFDVIGYDDNAVLIQQLQNKQPPINEPQLLDLLITDAHHLFFTADLASLKACDLVFITCDVPTDDTGQSDLSIIQDLIKKALTVLAPQAILVILSQVPPGFTRQIPWLPVQLFYQVETLIFGRAIERALYPERYMVGMADQNKPLPDVYASLLQAFHCPILKMRYESAELAKIAINLFLVSSVSTTNTIAEICEVIGADWYDISPALQLDKRIGPHAYLSPGLGIAGGNLERDVNTLLKLGQRYQTETSIVSAWLKNANYRRDWVWRCLQQYIFKVNPCPVLCILGMAYKAGTHSTKNSPAIALIRSLPNHAIQWHDPVVKNTEIAHIMPCETIEEALKESDVCIVMTPWEIYQSLNEAVLKRYMRGRFIIDPYRLLANKIDTTQFHYFTLGKAYHAASTECNSP